MSDSNSEFSSFAFGLSIEEIEKTGSEFDVTMTGMMFGLLGGTLNTEIAFTDSDELLSEQIRVRFVRLETACLPASA